ncbi:MAG: bile acid:sodium symporter [Bacteroidota bacterium]
MISGVLSVDLLVNLVLALIMLGIGLSLTAADFRNIFLHPVSLVAALGIQIIGLPLVSFGIAAFAPLSAEMRVGLVLVSLCASGASSNLITHLLKGNVALAISMTVFNSIITLFSIPLLTNLALRNFMHTEAEIQLPFLETIVQIFMVSILPATVGLLIRRYKVKVAKALEKPLKYVLPALLATVFALKIFLGTASGGTGISVSETMHILPFMLLLNLLAMSLGFFGARVLRRPFADQFTISIEVGLHNTALALLISGNILQNAGMQKPAVVYAMFSFFTAILYVVIIKKIFEKRTEK